VSVAYQGLAGAFSEAAAATLFAGLELRPLPSFADVFAALERREVDVAVLPVENTHAGSVVDVYDLLRRHANLSIVAEAVVRVRQCLLAVPGATLSDIRRARSHPQALAQVDEFLRGHGIAAEAAYDTAGAAFEVARAGDPAVAAIASRRAAAHYGLTVLAESIETTADNFTRFFALARRGEEHVSERIPAALRAGPAKTSLAYTAKNVPGALTRSLQPFATAGLQLTKIESRPSRVAAWDYVFYLDFEGDPAVSPSRRVEASA